MSEDQAYLRKVSTHVSRTLNDIGLNMKTVKRRRWTYLLSEKNLVLTLFLLDSRGLYEVYHFGSQSEGTTTRGLCSDIDTLTCCTHDNIVIQDSTEMESGKVNYLMLTEDAAPGYCHLQLMVTSLRTIAPIIAISSESCTWYIRDGVLVILLKNTSLRKPLLGQQVRKGPATSEVGIPYSIDTDYVHALKCNSWPRQAKSFTSRPRHHGWPSVELLRQVTQDGCFLVPVGYKLSHTEHLEWRLSFSLAERRLMFNLNIIHLKCLVLLKYLVKTFIEPYVQNSITSYHCKTALLYCIENTKADFWRGDNLLNCVNSCLVLLRTWVRGMVCPQYIISEANLFAGKVNVQNKEKLLSILKDIITSNGRALLCVLTDGFGDKLRVSFNPEPISELIFLRTLTVIAQLEYARHEDIHDLVKETMLHNKYMSPKHLIRYIYQNICMLLDRQRLSDKHERLEIRTLVNHLYCWMGSLLASVSLSRRLGVHRMALRLIYSGPKSDIATMLKLASVLYNNGDFFKCKAILDKLSMHFNIHGWRITPICACYKTRMLYCQDLVYEMHGVTDTGTRDELFAHCVLFSPQEIHCMPPALQVEFFRSIGDNIHRINPVEERCMGLTAVDCLSFLLYLLYNTYRQLGKEQLRKNSLSALEYRARTYPMFGHRETVYNLLGHCLELEQNPEDALSCYIKSSHI